jgi:hypothetical protein
MSVKQTSHPLGKGPLIKTPMLKRYLIKFAIRIAIFVAILVLYLEDRELLYHLTMQPVWKGVAFIHVLWLYFMVMMLLHIFPIKSLSMALRKSKEGEYAPTPYSELELHRFVHDQNIKAWTVMLVWLVVNAVWGLLYLIGILQDSDLLMLTVFYFLCDYICILLFCPFQSGIMKNKCCINCRIYDWGHFMMFTPMLFIRNFFSWSLFFTSCVVLIHWELIYAKHPERFWSGSNATLRCANCKDQTCQLKRRVTGAATAALQGRKKK